MAQERKKDRFDLSEFKIICYIAKDSSYWTWLTPKMDAYDICVKKEKESS
jgi:hypothetical protein